MQTKDPTKKVALALEHVSAKVNKVLALVGAALKVLVLPQWSQHEARCYAIHVLQILSCDIFFVTLAKILQIYYQIENFLLLLSLSSILPFLVAAYSYGKFIPCPPMAAVISNAGLFTTFAMLVAIGLTTYTSYWIVFAYVMAFWPWLALIAMLSRLFIEPQTTKRNIFSPMREIPVLGVMGGVAQTLILMAAKRLSVTDCIVYLLLDPILTAVMAPICLGEDRQKLHSNNSKVYCGLGALMLVYSLGETGPGLSVERPPAHHHVLFAFARVLTVARSLFVKRRYAQHERATIPEHPPESSLCFINRVEPKKHRFERFAAPQLLRLDAIFDSGLRDSDFHALGPEGTRDLYLLTDFTYMMPIASMMAYLNEFDTLRYGILPPGFTDDVTNTANAVVDTSSFGMATAVVKKTSTVDVIGVAVVALAFCLAKILVPWAMSRSLYDRGSSPSAWKYNPLLIAAPFVCLDILYFNDQLSKFQIIVVFVASAILAHYRANLWTAFHRKYLLLCTRQLHYHKPAALREVQRETLLKFLKKTSTDDYGLLLLDTVIRHGNNVQDIARDTRTKIWDPAPTATAAWKLSFSLVMKSIRHQKSFTKEKVQEKENIIYFVKGLVLEIVFKAVDAAEGHGRRLWLAGTLAGVVSKRRAIRKLHKLAVRRREIRQKRARGDLAACPAILATAGGKIRSAQEMHTLPHMGMRPTPLALPAPGSEEARAAAGRLPLSLTASLPGGGAGGGGGLGLLPQQAIGDSQESAISPPSIASLPMLPGMSREDRLGPGRAGDSSPGDGSAPVRGIWAAAGASGSPVAAVVVAFGDVKRGQLGVDPVEYAKTRSHRSAMIIEELRGCEPVQVEASGAASFVLGSQGQAWAFGSNRSMEIGMRKEVTQLNGPQRVKPIRQSRIVQIASSPAMSGQAHTLALTAAGEVYTFGTSTCGALGQGPQVKQTSPLLLRMTKEVRIHWVAAGARHSLMVTDDRRLYSMGDNTYGQLGTNELGSNRRSLKYADTPVLVGGALVSKRVCLLAVGDNHALATTEDEQTFAWGSNACGQLGLNRSDDQPAPQLVRDLHSAAPTSLACGARHSLVVGCKGTHVWAFGSNKQGQLGIGQNTIAEGHQRALPTPCRALSGNPAKIVVQVAAAATHSLAVMQSGEVYAFGENGWGQLGFPPEGTIDRTSALASTRPAPSAFGARSFAYDLEAQERSLRAGEIDAQRAFSEGVPLLWQPTRVASLALYHVRSVATGDTHTLALAM